MRVAIDARKITDFGIGTYLRGLLGGLADVGTEESYVVFAPAAARALIPEEFEHVVLETPKYSVRELVTVARAVERTRADVFHAPHYVVPFTKCATVVTIHDLIHLHQPMRNPVAPAYARLMMRRAVRKSARVLTVSSAVKQQLVRELRCPESKIVVTPNGVDDIFRAEQANRSPAHYYLFVGNDKPHKNVDRLVEAYANVRWTIGEPSLVLVGAPYQRFGAYDGVVTPGYVTARELASLYRNAIALVQPSLEEGFGLPALEAMSSGTAVITSLDAALVEITGNAAIHVEANSVRDIAAAMQRLVTSDSLRVELAQRGIARAKHFTWTACARETLRVYRAAARAKRVERA